MLTHWVEINGDITYSLHGRAVLRDEGRRVAVLDEHSEEVIAAGLLLAAEKFGSHLGLTGSPEFQRRVVSVAVLHGIAIKFVDPQLEAMRVQLTDEKRQSLRDKVVLVLAPALILSNKSAQRGMDGLDAATPAASTLPPGPHPVDIPVNAVPSADASPLTPEKNNDLERTAEAEVAKAKLIADLQSQGREVRKVDNGVQYLGKVEITADGRFAVQSLGRAVVVIHDLALLDGHYTSGEEAHIKYLNGRGQDKWEQQAADRPDGVGR